jgi:hypothetical protein
VIRIVSLETEQNFDIPRKTITKTIMEDDF